MTFFQGQPLKLGQIVGGHYRIVKPLGNGGFGETYLAEDTQVMNKKVALKRFTFVSTDPAIFNKAKELFKRESDVLYKLTNPFNNTNIPQFFACFEENQELYLVQEFIEGETFRDELRRRRTLREDEVIELLKDVLRVLKFIHQANIIHRDIKPENLIRRKGDRQFVLIDFGAVKEEVAKTFVNSSSPAKGTQIYSPGYTPREQHSGNAKEYSDIYALGMTAIEALTGLEPKDLPEDRRTGEIIWRDKAQVSDGFAKILEKMVRDDWKQRYRSAVEVLEAVEKLNKLPLSLWFAVLGPIVMFVYLGVAFLVNSNYNYEKTNPKSSENTSATKVNKSGREVNQPGKDKRDSSTSNKGSSDSESGLRFKRSQPKLSPASQPVEPSSSPTPTNENDSDMPIRFKRATPKSTPNTSP